MRLLILLLIVSACAGIPRREPEPVQPIVPQPAVPLPKKPERPVTIITVNPPAKPQAICVPLAVDQRKRILEAFECAYEIEKAEKTKK